MLNQKTSMLYYATAILALISLLLSGCSDREESQEAKRQLAPGYNAKANKALQEAEAAMKEAEIEIDFSEVGLESVADLRTILPDPLQIAQLEKQEKMEEAIDSLYDAMDAISLDPLQIAQLEKQQQVGAAPARPLIVSGGVSNEDLALLHLHLSYLYILSAVSRLSIAGMGPDGVYGTADDLYYVDFSGDLEKELVIYELVLTDRGQTLMDSVDPTDPYGYIKVFYSEGTVEDGKVRELQAAIDALLLLLGAEVAVIENPAEGIMAHEPSVDRETFQYNALYHLNQALLLAGLIFPALEDALGEFDEIVTEYFSKEILQKAIEWGFEIREVPPRYEYLLE